MDSERTFKSQYRFAGTNYNHGFYFSNTPHGCISEFFYYNKIFSKINELYSDVDIDFCSLLNSIDKNKVLLKCNFDFSFDKQKQRYLDLTNEYNVEQVLNGLSYKASSIEDFSLRSILAPTSGGNILTDFIGAYLSTPIAVSAVHFPCLRALWTPSAEEFNSGYEFALDSFKRKINTPNGNSIYFDTLDADASILYVSPMTDPLRGNIQSFAQKYFNVVFFNGIYILTALKSIEIIQKTKSHEEENPYFQIKLDQLDELRIEEADKLNLTFDKALSLGLVNQKIINERLEINIHDFVDRVNNPEKYYS